VKKRYFAKRPKSLPKGYDSQLEKDLHDTIFKGYNHHPQKVDYHVDHTYEVDFINPSEPNILIEVKGRFRDSQDAARYKWIQKCNPDKELVFVFEKPETPMPFSKKRKDGTKISHGEWATKNGFRWYTKETWDDSDSNN
jgi:hypothetical protein